MSLLLKNLLVNVAYYGVTLVALPWLALWTEDALRIARTSSPVLRGAASVLAVAGGALQLSCITLFHTRGKGTPSPVAATRQLVMTGPYGWLRNPLNVGELMVFLALAAWFGSVTLLAYTLGAAMVFHVYIVCWEEPRLCQRYGRDYEAYAVRTPRWWPQRPRR